MVTGLGAVTPIGNTVAEYWANLIAGQSGAAPITRFDTSKFKTTFACEVKNFDADGLLGRKFTQRTDLYLHFAIAASDQAIQDAKLDQVSDKSSIGVFFSSGIGGLNSLQKEVTEFAKGDGTPRFSALLVPKMIVDAAAGNISIRHGFKGPTAAIVTACASSTHSMAMAFDQIRLGRAKVMVVGGAEAAINEIGVGAFSSLKALSTNNENPAAASRPFDATRDGFVLGEGAGALIFEEYEHAIARGAHIYCEVAGAGLSGDAYHITAPDPSGEGAADVMLRALHDAGMQPEDIDHINTHSTSTELGDLMETKAVEKAFGEAAYQLNISGTKSMTGHLLGAAGAIESIATILAVQHNLIPPTINFGTLDPEISPKLRLTPNKAEAREVRAALNNNFGFGGHNACVIFKKIS